MSVTCYGVQLAPGSFCFQGHWLSLGSLGQFARGRGSPLRSRDLGGFPSVLAGRGARRRSGRLAHRLGHVWAHGLDVRDVEVRGVASSAAAPSAPGFASRAAGVFPRVWSGSNRKFQEFSISCTNQLLYNLLNFSQLLYELFFTH